MSLVTEYKNEQTSPDQSFFRAALYSCTTSNSGNRDAIARMLEDDDKVRKISTEYWNEGFENLAHDRGAHLLKRMLELRSDDITPTAINAAVKRATANAQEKPLEVILQSKRADDLVPSSIVNLLYLAGYERAERCTEIMQSILKLKQMDQVNSNEVDVLVGCLAERARNEELALVLDSSLKTKITDYGIKRMISGSKNDGAARESHIVTKVIIERYFPDITLQKN